MEELIELIKNKDFKYFCDLIDYLLLNDKEKFKIAANNANFYNFYITSIRNKK